MGEIIDGPKKAELLKKLAAKEGLDLAQTIAIGDGANDLFMLDAAGLGVAFNAKSIVREQADLVISNMGLDGLLYILGIQDRKGHDGQFSSGRHRPDRIATGRDGPQGRFERRGTRL